jgi:ketosteroid isomerase-like protein
VPLRDNEYAPWDSQLPETLGIELRDVHVTASGDLALAHWTWRFVGIGRLAGAAEVWYRATAGYRRIREQWKMIHLHESLPFDQHDAARGGGFVR